ncbi:Uncharacterised protein [Starkeya nomas]|uniref:Uncharacterized protein n=1 Tax=Starkeya nomas TaxID=2666134 RepID=A0A5S9PC01_9HYPH|nr:hypothetical protein [Starkeya nomas]CAA0101314.1 Uncharacterised protein [Starkeya nomas]
MTKKEYRITAARPIDGRMRKPGETVSLDQRQYDAEKRWGGLEPVQAELPKGRKPAAGGDKAD